MSSFSSMSKQNTTDGILDLVDRCLAVIPPAEPSLPRENDIQSHIHHLLAQRQSPGRCISEEPLPWHLGQEMIKTPSSPSMSRPPWCGLAGQHLECSYSREKRPTSPSASRLLVSTRISTEKSALGLLITFLFRFSKCHNPSCRFQSPIKCKTETKSFSGAAPSTATAKRFAVTLSRAPGEQRRPLVRPEYHSFPPNMLRSQGAEASSHCTTPRVAPQLCSDTHRATASPNSTGFLSSFKRNGPCRDEARTRIPVLSTVSPPLVSHMESVHSSLR